MSTPAHSVTSNVQAWALLLQPSTLPCGRTRGF